MVYVISRPTIFMYTSRRLGILRLSALAFGGLGVLFALTLGSGCLLGPAATSSEDDAGPAALDTGASPEDIGGTGTDTGEDSGTVRPDASGRDTGEPVEEDGGDGPGDTGSMVRDSGAQRPDADPRADADAGCAKEPCERHCTGDGRVIICTLDEQSCTVSRSERPCAEGEVCQDGQCVACPRECDPATDGKTCRPSAKDSGVEAVWECKDLGGGCAKWEQVQACSNGVCGQTAGSGEPTCLTHECSKAGEVVKCDVNGTHQRVCRKLDSGQRVLRSKWCGEHKICDPSTKKCACENPCRRGERECYSGYQFRRCKLFGNGCRDWEPSSKCMGVTEEKGLYCPTNSTGEKIGKCIAYYDAADGETCYRFELKDCPYGTKCQRQAGGGVTCR